MPYDEKSYEASKKYKAQNIKRIPLDVQLSEYEAIKNTAAALGESVNGFIKKAIRERIDREGVTSQISGETVSAERES